LRAFTAHFPLTSFAPLFFERPAACSNSIAELLTHLGEFSAEAVPFGKDDAIFVGAKGHGVLSRF
jgi:hypothetical protein